MPATYVSTTVVVIFFPVHRRLTLTEKLAAAYMPYARWIGRP